MSDDPESTTDKDATPKEEKSVKTVEDKESARRSGLGLGTVVLAAVIFIRTVVQVNRQLEMRVPVDAIVASYAQGIFVLLALATLSTCISLMWKVDAT